jgi:ABC-2 type transport system ATP-binding protein
MLAIEAKNITKVYKGSRSAALKDFSLEVEAGTIFTLLGRNGAGKTTFVRMCATQLMPTSGEITALGFDAVKQANEVRKLISVVPQEGRPLRALTPWDHVYNWLRIRGETKQEARKKTLDMLSMLELYDVKDKPAMYLSGGMKQKILVAMAMAADAQLLFLDEPTIGLDPVSRRQVWSAIKSWKEEGRSVLLTTHYMDEAEILSDNIAIVDGGRAIVQGTMQELRKVIPQNVRVDISRNGLSEEMLKPFGSVVDTGAGSLRVFTYESAVRELSDLAIKKNLSFTVSPVTLDDIFVSLVKRNIDDDSRHAVDSAKPHTGDDLEYAKTGK